MKIHRVKCFNRFFEQIISGAKLFEVRKNDRIYQPGELIELNETKEAEYTGRAALFEISSVLTSDDFPEGIKSGYAVIGLKPLTAVYTDYEKEKGC